MNYQWFQDINNLSVSHPVLDGFMIFLSQKALYIYAIVLLVFWMRDVSYKRLAIYSGITGIVGLIVNYIITLFYYEPRPFVSHHVHLLFKHAADASFPSDHTTGAFALSFAVFLTHKKLGSAMLAAAALTGLSRIWVGQHYPLDVAGSIVVAGIISILIYMMSPVIDPFVKVLIRKYTQVQHHVKHAIWSK
ncbi:undecaprenyl-diphosphatase [Fictibacillus fluitans]|uniref:Undecaprenyl-diphosphatase n=1 Tax=Fictibacillus fluitans TaxID=3058422 RepID=A0ABT8HUZ5_9BACL|nr:undecaprenyl-diphosphatase [Fictibacillus sp. NE201]MDN4524554.1 undecaprenyl-diphosphatase [Fictibacillus sp. NE201]